MFYDLTHSLYHAERGGFLVRFYVWQYECQQKPVNVCRLIFEVFLIIVFHVTYSVKPFAQPGYAGKPATAVSSSDMSLQAPPPPPWEGRAIATHKLRLVEFSAFMEQQRDADTVSF